MGQGSFAYHFQVGRNCSHQLISWRDPSFNDVSWVSLETVLDKSIRRCMKVQPDGTTFAAKESLPIRESNSRLVHLLVFRQETNRTMMDLTFSLGNRDPMAAESMVIPR